MTNEPDLSHNRDWSAIRAEYIGGGTTYRKLAEKYGVGLTTIAVRASEEGWTKDRELARDKARDATISRTAEIAAENAVKLEYAKALMIDRVICALENMPDGIGTRIKQSQKDVQQGKQVVMEYDVLKLVSALERLSTVSAGALSRQLEFESGNKGAFGETPSEIIDGVHNDAD